jgi:hypothetical protein
MKKNLFSAQKMLLKECEPEHYWIDGFYLAECRKAAGFETQHEFAQLCGWNQQYQSLIESEKSVKITVLAAVKIISALSDFKTAQGPKEEEYIDEIEPQEEEN